MAKATQLADVDQEVEVPSQDAAYLDQEAGTTMGVQLDGTEGAVQDPPTQEEQMVDPVLSSEVVLVEKEDDPAESGVPIVEGT